MLVSDADSPDHTDIQEALTKLPFPPITHAQILHCSYHYWHPLFRAITPKARLIPLNAEFIEYLRADGIFLPPDSNAYEARDDIWDSGTFDEGEDDGEDEAPDPSTAWPDIHLAVKSTIRELGGKVVPKLNWSAPKDATWMNTTNSMDCRTPNDIYMLLKASDFVTHDLEHAFDGCADDTSDILKANSEIPYHLVLRKQVAINRAVEFRCFVRRRRLLGACQRDLNHYAFLFTLRSTLLQAIQTFFDTHLRHTFPDENFVFDVYIPAPHQRVWLIDVNPWAPRTDPLLFSWLELLTAADPENTALHGGLDIQEMEQEVVKLSLDFRDKLGSGTFREEGEVASSSAEKDDDNDNSDNETDSVESVLFQPELRLIDHNDPQAYNFNSTQYSAHKLPKDVVDASQGGLGSLREFADQWKEIFDRPGVQT